MILKSLFFFFTFLISCSLNGQQITGQWYEIENSDSSLKIKIDETNHSHTGTFSWEWENRKNTVNAPLDQVSIKNDSLFLSFTHANNTLHCKLKWKENTNTYEGFMFANSRKLKVVTLSRMPIVRDLAKNKNAKKLATRQDSLRGMITPERAWWDLTYYHLEIKVEPENKYISGKNTIQYRVEHPYQVMQIDLQAPLVLTKAKQNGHDLDIKHDGNAHYIHLKDEQKIGEVYSVEVYYEGHPTEAANAPWDGGFSWKKDTNGNHFIATSCQGIGASIW